MIEIAFSVFLLYIAYVRPYIAIGILVNIYVLKGILMFDPNNICFSYKCLIPSTPFLSIILPLSAFLLILFRFRRLNKIFLRLNIVDLLMVYLIIIVTVYIMISPSIMYSFLYWMKFITIGISYYFIGKLIFSNYPFSIALKNLLISIYFIGILAAFFSIYILLHYGIFTIRLTIPGIHPIPFSLLVGYCLLISQYFLLFYETLNVKNTLFLRLNIAVFLFLFIILLLTNTRGVLFSTIGVILIVYVYYTKYIKKIKDGIIISLLTLICLLPFAFVWIFNFTEFSILFNRLLHMSNDQSVIDRIIAYKQAIKIFESKIFGVGTGAFKYYSFLEYPHNFLLENLANYGILGLVFDYSFVLSLIFFLIKFFKRKDNIGIILIGLVLLSFTESLFSFTLWMYKTLYLFLGILSAYISIRRKL